MRLGISRESDYNGIRLLVCVFTVFLNLFLCVLLYLDCTVFNPASGIGCHTPINVLHCIVTERVN